ncbi:uncharacterized protein LOC118577058 [Onychomys torridus]|uniref:uncharacterized protein LOC118577058 n=1 Tax=Onychomys torridus TaxID=38674 RepID=UPI00167F52DF|nr:uncharacterized protein LOC118577058 [Onychomys torridus]
MPMTCDVKCRQVASVMLISPCGRRVPISRPALWLSCSLSSDSVSRSGASRRSLVGLGGPWPRVPLLLFFQAGPQGRALSLKTSPLVSPSSRHRAAESLSGQITDHLSREIESAPAALPSSGRRRSRELPKNPGGSLSPERAEGAFYPRPAEPFRKRPKSSERPSCRTAGGGRSAMLDALLVE